MALLISGRQDGYIEPCGCTGLANQKGGMLRREVLYQQLTREMGWDVVGVDTGNQIHRTGPQSQLKLHTTWGGLVEAMRYSTIGIGPEDIKNPSIDSIQFLEETKETRTGSPAQPKFVAANIQLYDYFEPFQIIEAGGKKIGVTMLVGDAELAEIAEVAEADYVRIPVAEALANVVPKLRRAQCDVYILGATMSLDACREIVQQYPLFDFVLAGCGVGEPTREPEPIQVGDHLTSLIQIGSKSMHSIVIGLYFDGGKLTSRYQRVPMDARFEVESKMEKMKAIFRDYQMALAKMTWKDLAIDPREHPTGLTFAGSDSCQQCHEGEYEIWKHGFPGPNNPERIGPHFVATQSLLHNPNGDRTWVTREHDPECLSCHVTGWNPQGYYPYQTGFTRTEDVAMHANGCENCHGPGSAHNEVETRIKELQAANQAVPAELTARQKEALEGVKVTMKQARQKLCVECHDLDNSPDFSPDTFDDYWKQIYHTKQAIKKLEAAKQPATGNHP